MHRITSKLTDTRKLGELYECDFPSPDCLESELHSWQLKWQKQLQEHGEASLPSSPTLTISQVSSVYPNISTLLKLFCTLPVTSCSAERSFSKLKRIKTPFRSAMTTTCLSGLTLLDVHRDIAIDIPAAIDECKAPSTKDADSGDPRGSITSFCLELEIERSCTSGLFFHINLN